MASPPGILSVLACDDHPIVRSGVRLILAGTPEFRLVAEAGDAEQTLAALATHRPDLVILDLWMGGNDGLELLRHLLQRQPGVRVLVYSVNDETVFGPRTLRAGAVGYLHKQYGLDELVAALRVIAAGDRYLSPVLTRQLTDAALRAGPTWPENDLAALAGLTDRELQVLRLLGTGQSSAAIAQALGISVRTVGAHRENLKNKLGLPDAAALVHRAMALTESRQL